MDYFFNTVLERLGSLLYQKTESLQGGWRLGRTESMTIFDNLCKVNHGDFYTG